jgi:poly(3-hydroxybutyrate) depolymerase
MNLHLRSLLLIVAALLTPSIGRSEEPLDALLARAGQNRAELEAALDTVAARHRGHLEFLLRGMPQSDLRTLSAEFLLEHVTLAVEAWEEAPWKAGVPVEVFREAILPYASVDERRDRWRPSMRRRCLPLVEGIRDAGLATATLNRELYPLVGVKYSTKRPKANQSSDESIEAGLASCTGLSILLIDACRSLGIPARFVGTPLWSDGSGNHSWVEVWHEGGWHFTGAAEPTGDELDRGWFLDRASRAIRGDPRHAIFATTWRRTPLHFPQVWSPEDTSIHAVDVTDRYTERAGDREPIPEGMATVRFRLRDRSGARIARAVQVSDGGGAILFTGTTRDEGFDANDHLTTHLPPGAAVVWETTDGVPIFRGEFIVREGEQLVEGSLAGELPAPTLSGVLGELELFLRSGATLEEIPRQEWASRPLSREVAEQAGAMLAEAFAERTRAERKAEIDAKEITLGDHTLKWLMRSYGDRPAGGWSLWISMHGGGGAPPELNDSQWRNQIGLYHATMEELGGCLVIAPRAPTNTWNLWHQKHIDPLFDRLITSAVHVLGVDPDRIYLGGYSAGGDGVYQLAPRMADRFAGAAMSAGHPNETRPDGLRNIPFALHMGADDGAYKRNEVAAAWKEQLASLRDADPEGYAHQVELHEGKGHWMDREDAVAIPWLSTFGRDLRPRRIVWLQDDVTHDRFYWLFIPSHDGSRPRQGQRVVIERSERGFELKEARDVPLLHIRIDDTMLDLDREFAVWKGEELLWGGRAMRTIATLATTLLERGDPRGMWSASIQVPIPEELRDRPDGD